MNIEIVATDANCGTKSTTKENPSNASSISSTTVDRKRTSVVANQENANDDTSANPLVGFWLRRSCSRWQTLVLSILMGGILFAIPLGITLRREKTRCSTLRNRDSSLSAEESSTSNAIPPQDDKIGQSNVSSSYGLSTNVTVAAFYYPWYTENQFTQYVRGVLDPPQLPQLGLYNQRDPNVISQHLTWSRQANIGVWFTSWWGRTSNEDDVIRNNILTNPSLGKFQIALLYETLRLVPVLQQQQTDVDPLAGVLDDIHYIAKNYFGHPNYYRINNKPVMFIYLARVLHRFGILNDFVYLLRSGASQMGFDEIYIIGDVVFGELPDISVDNNNNITSQHAAFGGAWYEPFYLLDAVGTYDVYGSIGVTGYASQDDINNFTQRQRAWRDAAHEQKCHFIPTISPGFNDRGVRAGNDPVSRQLVDNNSAFHDNTTLKSEGSLFRALLNMSLDLVETDRNLTGSLLLVTSWNEWREDTQIEPTIITNAASNESSTNRPFDVTAGLHYNAYGELYLDILRNATTTS